MGETHLNAICPFTEMELNAMAEVDARKLDDFGDESPDGRKELGFAAKKAAAHLRAMCEVRRQRRQEEKSE